MSFQAAGRSSTLQIVRQQGLLQFEANQDVQVVRRFVGLDADQRRPHVVDREIKRVELDVGQRLGKRLLGRGEEVLPKGPAAADQVLPHPRLRFVNPQRHGLRRRQAVQIGAQALVVHAVPRLVQNAEKRAVEKNARRSGS